MNLLLFLLILIVFLTMMITVVFRFNSLFPIFKALCSLTFVGIAIVFTRTCGLISLPFLMAFIFSFLGDLFLIKPEYNVMRRLGFVSFLLAQLHFSIGLIRVTNIDSFTTLELFFLSIFVAAIIVVVSRDFIKLDLKEDVSYILDYTTFLSLSVLLSLKNYLLNESKISLILFIGFILFFLSDSVLSTIYYDKNNEYIELPENDKFVTIRMLLHGFTYERELNPFEKILSAIGYFVWYIFFTPLLKIKFIKAWYYKNLYSKESNKAYITMPHTTKNTVLTAANLTLYYAAQFIIVFTIYANL